MVNKDRRIQIYDAVFNFIIKRDICRVPIDLGQVCNFLNIDLVPLSNLMTITALAENDIFAVWGNQDGCLISNYSNSPAQHKIMYNDYKPIGRRRFTIAEEIAHIILNHLDNESFNTFHQSYAADTYSHYDEEARICAGLLLCPPQFFYSCEPYMQPSKISELLNVTPSCAEARYKILKKHKREIQSHPLYDKLPPIYVQTSFLRGKNYIEFIKDDKGNNVAFRFKKLSPVV